MCGVGLVFLVGMLWLGGLVVGGGCCVVWGGGVTMVGGVRVTNHKLISSQNTITHCCIIASGSVSTTTKPGVNLNAPLPSV